MCPDSFHAGELVFAGRLKALLETGARQRPETPERQQQAYADIRNSLEALLSSGQLWQEDQPGLYIYEVSHNGSKQTGVWALTALEDYRSGAIKVHEQTLSESVRRLRNYREQTGLEGSPVLLTYRPDELLHTLIANAKLGPVIMALGNSQGKHRLWKVDDPERQELFIHAFRRIEKVYLADGHHRLESAKHLAHGYDHISSLYIAADELRIEPYDRVVIPGTPKDTAELIQMANLHFHLLESTGNRPVRPDGPCRIGMLLEGQWYHLMPKTYCCGDTSDLDAEILQKHLLEPVFGITDPRTDHRLKYAGGENALDEIGLIARAHPEAVAFTLCPLDVEQLISAAERNQVLPPKATWIAPKVPYGLLIHHHTPQKSSTQ